MSEADDMAALKAAIASATNICLTDGVSDLAAALRRQISSAADRRFAVGLLTAADVPVAIVITLPPPEIMSADTVARVIQGAVP